MNDYDYMDYTDYRNDPSLTDEEVQEQERAREMRDNLLEIESGLTHYELEFIESLSHRLESVWLPSVIEQLNEIYERIS